MLTIAHLTFHEALRRKALLAALLLGIGFLVIFTLGYYFIYKDLNALRPPSGVRSMQQAGIVLNFIVTAGLYAVNFLIVMMGALMPVDAIAGEIRSGTIQTLVTKPIRRAEIVLGKWLGLWVILMLYLLLMAGGVLLIAYTISGYAPPNIEVGIPLMLLEGTLLMTLAIAGGTRFSTLANGVMVFGLYGLAFIGGWVEQAGAIFGNTAASNIGIIASLIVPSDALWRLAAYHMQPPLVGTLGASPFASASVPSEAMIWWAMGYVVVALLWGLWQFNQRDL
jgi:ABC-type transport system involved in multi-copper enzyme maturation permease subunit